MTQKLDQVMSKENNQQEVASRLSNNNNSTQEKTTKAKSYYEPLNVSSIETKYYHGYISCSKYYFWQLPSRLKH